MIILLIFVLILINGFFSASEMALVSIKPSELSKIIREGKRSGLTLEKITKDSTEYLSTIQVAITFAGFLSSAFAGSQLSNDFVSLLAGINITISESLSVILITVILSFFTLVLGELVPKRIAMANPKAYALFCAPVINVFMIVFKPFVWLLTASTNLVLRIFGRKPQDDEEKVTEREIKEMIIYGQVEGLYKEDEQKMMQRIFRLDDLTADLIMTPKSEVLGYDIADPDLSNMINSRYSRIPVYKENLDHIVGVLYTKDLLLELKDKSLNDVDIESIIRDPYIVSEDTLVNDLFKQMRESLKHLAFVVNKKGETEGIVTLEDVVEEIVGNIYDEHDIITSNDDIDDEMTYIIDGDNLVEDITGKLGFEIDKDVTKYKTIHDFIMSKLKKLPEVNEQPYVEITKGYLKVLNVEDGVIDQVELTVKEDLLEE